MTIPQGETPETADLAIVVVVTPTWWKKCAASFISLAVIMRESSCEKITVQPGDGLRPMVQTVRDTNKTCTQTSSVEEVGKAAVRIKIGDKSVKLYQTTKYDKYLNMEVDGLASETKKVGGILGVDEHDDVVEIPEECKHRKESSEIASLSFARVL